MRPCPARARALTQILSPFLSPQILEMAAENELDEPFMALLEQNIDGAREAGQADAALFMEKVRNACRKFAKVSPIATLEAAIPLVVPPPDGPPPPKTLPPKAGGGGRGGFIIDV